MTLDHLDEATVLRHLDGELDADRSVVLQAHLDTCSACRRLAESLERETALLREALVEDDELPQRFEASAPGAELSWALVLVAALGVGGVYWVWGSLVAPWWDRLDSVGLGGSTLLTTLFFRGILWKGWATMGESVLDALGLLALALAVASTGLVLRWAWRHSRIATAFVALLLAAVSGPSRVDAAEIKKGRETYTLGAGEVVHNDLVVAARTVRIEGTIEGDLIVVGRSVAVSGRVRGDVLALCQNLEVTGHVEGSVRNLSQFLEISGQVGRNVTAFCENAELGREGRIDGGFTAFAETVTTDGQVSRDLMAFTAGHEIRGTVGGSALLGGGRLEILPGARIEGDAEFFGDRQPEVSPEAQLKSPLKVRLDPKESRSRFARAGYYWGQALRWAAAFLLGTVLILLTPQFFSEVVRGVQRWAPALGVGALTTVALPLLSVVVAITVVGLAVGLTALLFYVLALYAAQIFVGGWLGLKILGEAKARGEWLQRLALGLLIIRGAQMVPVAGTVVWVAVIFLGVGGLATAMYKRMQAEPSPA